MSLVPAVAYKKEIEDWGNKLRYSKKMMMYNGCCEHGPMCIRDDWDNGDNYQWAIVDDDNNLVGYIAYKIDHYAKVAYSFGLIGFEDNPAVMMQGILAAIRHVYLMDPIRVEFRCVYDNKAKRGYDGIVNKFSDRYDIYKHHLHYLFRDEQGNYHDELIYELVRK